ncbi:MAG: CPBP family intramembrane glutamic endopeptidase [Reichenbachiella sp.]|uniref:CPBP family intramembrane glutamic endopeptidase n=1 Tax=Reichenbachiella sp. TaxID=2184521 RepID=UPI0032659B90
MTNSPQGLLNPFSHVMGAVLLSLFSFVFAPFLFLPLYASLIDSSLAEIMHQVMNNEPTIEIQLVLVAGQFSVAFCSFILIPAWYIKQYGADKLTDYFNPSTFKSNAALLTFGLTFMLMVVNSLLIEWNMNFQFPDAVAATFDQMEEQGRLMTEYLTNFKSPAYFICVLLVVAVVPAIGEELLFRGLIQKYLEGKWRNPHMAIWVTAVFFSAFHLQFYGFVPRLALGAFFGYLFYFSRNLWYASLAHFINNGFTLLMIYLFQLEVIKYDIETTESISHWTALAFAIIGAILFVLFRKQFHITDNLENE